MKLYYAPGACSLAVHTVLIWAGDDYELEKAEIDSDALKAINPMGAVPVLIDGDRKPMTQLTSLLKYIGRKFPEKNLCGPGGLENDQELDQWLSFLGSDLHPAFGPPFAPEKYTEKTDDESLNDIRNAGKKQLDFF